MITGMYCSHRLYKKGKRNCLCTHHKGALGIRGRVPRILNLGTRLVVITQRECDVFQTAAYAGSNTEVKHSCTIHRH